MMAVIIEEGSEESQIPAVETEDNAPAVEETVSEQVEDESEALPDKYRGKSAKDIAQMHMEAERLIGRQGSEVGELRRIVDDYIRAQAAAKQQLQTEDSEEVDFFADPRKAVENAIENHPKIRQAEQLTLEMQRSKALNALQAAHPDFQQVVTDPGFQSWISASKVRSELFVRANNQFDYDSANELLSLYKERKDSAQQTVAAEKQARSQAVRAATTTVSSGSDEAPTKKIFRRADIIKLMQTNPDKYDMMQEEIMSAYREGRVR
jgi:uncharacterized protein YqgQ